MEKEEPLTQSWLPVHDTVEVWKTMWRAYRSQAAPEDADYHLRNGTYGRGVLWARLPACVPHAAMLHGSRRHKAPKKKEWWRK